MTVQISDSTSPHTIKYEPLHDPTVDLHLKLQSHSYRIPLELIRRNFKTIQKLKERQVKKLDEFKKSLKSSKSPEQTKTIKKLMLANLKVFEKKLIKQRHVEEELLSRINARVTNLLKLKTLQDDYETGPSEITKDNLLNWYRDQTNLLVITHLLKNNDSNNNNNTCPLSEEDHLGLKLLKSLHMEKLVDFDVLTQANGISQDIKRGNLTSLINWITENKTFLNKCRSPLEFETRFQEYIELIKNNKTKEALGVFQTHLSFFIKTNFEQIKLASSLLLINPSSLEKYRHHTYKSPFFAPGRAPFDKYLSLFDDERYVFLSKIFEEVFYKLNGIPESDPLLVYLSLGISTLKTKSCECKTISPSDPIPSFEEILHEKLTSPQNLEKNLHRINGPKCPICSPELHALSSNLPHAHNIKSSLFDSPVMLPNGNIYDREKLIMFTKVYISTNAKDVEIENVKDSVMDPVEGKWFEIDDLVTVFPS